MKKSFKKAKVGDEVEVIVNGKSENGRLLESYDVGVVLLKLENGYNVGFKREDVSEIKVVRERKVDSKKDEGVKVSGRKPVIEMIVTGGTISSKLDSSTGGVEGLIDNNELLKMYPEIFEIADFRIKSPFMKVSENMTPVDWIKIAKLVGKALNDPGVKGVIVSHGTDTLHYTASALSFMLGKLNKPVVLTYSQRSSDRGSSDARMNLICSVRAALSDVSEVMLVGHATINDDYCFMLQGNKCRKLHSSRRDTFRPVNCKPYGKIWPDGKMEMIRNDYRKRNKNEVEVDAVFDPKVGLFKAHPASNPSILDYYKKNCKGLVIEGTGFGHVITEGKSNWLPKLKEAMGKGLLIYMASQTIFGRVDSYVYSPGRKIADSGVVFLGDMLSETALVKLGWVLGHKDWRGSVSTKLKMLENVSGEFNDRLDEGFLEM
ncbi:Glu-tRNA(Gln) amidotransferase GatDE subunit D [Candidatus Pacearchaeota archaeon]|nr:Glu-tRNA(Gln) amidotransferase GatDE subunit D [Candidatus Pacearchaeota archaeon]